VCVCVTLRVNNNVNNIIIIITMKYQFLSKLSDPGGLFDPMSNYACFVPVVLHVAVITALNMCYQAIAHWLTNAENPAYEQQYQNSVILKRFFFESFDCCKF
jgi:hypothetical protein